MTASGQVFDGLAPTYDPDFSDTLIGGLMRQRVWYWLDQGFAPGQRVLELNCGTGVDAVHLAQRDILVDATDASEQMLRVARSRVAAAGMAQRVRLHQMAIEDLAAHRAGHLYDGVLSNFGGLNCVAALDEVASALRQLCRPGARVFLCVMGPVTPWEWLWFLPRGQFAKAFRRLSRRASNWHGIDIYYPSISQLRRAFTPGFRMVRQMALGALLPPPFTESWACRHPVWVHRLNRWEQRWEQRFLLPWLADHYLVELHAE